MFLRRWHAGFEFGKGHLDRVKIGRIWREVEERRTRGLDRLPDPTDAMGRKVVHDNNITGREFRHEHLCDIGAECIAIHRSIDQPWCGNSTDAQPRSEGGGLPMAVRHGRLTAFAARRTAIKTRHLRRCPGLVDEDELRGIEAGLPLKPSLTGTLYVRSLLLGGMRNLFFSVMR